jgi:hypothetical protein
METTVSIEYYVEGFHLGSPAGLDANRVLECFEPRTSEPVDGLYRLVYDASNICDMSLTEERGEVTSICIFRPCAHEQFDRDLSRLLGAGPYVLFAPDGNALLVGREDMRSHIPPDMIEALGEPVVVDAGANIGSALFD